MIGVRKNSRHGSSIWAGAAIVAFCAATFLASIGSASADAAFDAKAEKIFKDASAAQTVHPPADGPKAAKGKSLVIIPCAMAAEGCARQARAVQEAAKAIGWTSTLIDPAGDTSKMANAVQKAIDIKADGIILTAIDANTIQGALQQAKQAGLKIVAEGESVNGIYDGEMPLNPHQYFINQGYVVGASSYVLGGKKLHMIQMRDDEFASVKARSDGTQQFIKECQAAGGDCKMLTTVNTLVTDLTTQIPKQAVSLVQRYPDYNTLWTGYDAALSFVIEQGLKQADLLNTGFAVGFDANVANAAIMRNDGYERADLGLPLEWLGWGMVDQINRAFNGQPANVDEGVRDRLLTKDTLPTSGPWQGDVDFRADYKKVWGVN
jgi:ribose transport system substrate-binding protein